MSGGLGKEGYDEGVAMRQYLAARGVPESAIITDSLGNTTRASAVNAAAYAKSQNFTSVYVVTQYFHVPRTALALKQCGVPGVFTAHADWLEWRDIYSSLRDAAGYLTYYFKY